MRSLACKGNLLEQSLLCKTRSMVQQLWGSIYLNLTFLDHRKFVQFRDFSYADSDVRKSYSNKTSPVLKMV